LPAVLICGRTRSTDGGAITVEFERAIVRIPAGASPRLVSAVLRSVKP
jgi:transposase